MPLAFMAGGSFALPKPRPNGPPYFSRNQVANVLHQVAVLLELQGANVFRVRSYQNASRMLGSLTEDLGELVASGEILARVRHRLRRNVEADVVDLGTVVRALQQR